MLHLNDPSLLRQQAYYDGQWHDADDGSTIPVANPATGELVGTVPNMGAAETRRAIQVAQAAWPAWRQRTATERNAILRRWNDQWSTRGCDMLQALCEDAFANEDTHRGALKHSCYSRPHNEGVDSATMFGDFFFVEALCRVALPGRLRPELPVGA